MNFANPEENIQAFGLRKGMMVADFGAGSGAYSFLMSRAVGSDGRVYAIEVQRDLLGRLKDDAKKQGLHNIEILCSDLERSHGSKLGDMTMDVVLISNTLFQAESKYQLIVEAKRVLKPDGRIILIDWTSSFGHLGPHSENVVTANMAREIFKEAGLVEVSEFSAGPHHYGLIFKKTN